MSGVSTLAQLTAQLQRFNTLNTQFADLQRALATNKKTTSYQGLGQDALTTLSHRASISANTRYVQNISVASTRIKAVDSTLGLVQKQVKQIQQGLLKQPLDGQVDITDVQAYTKKLLEIIPGSLNEDLDGRFVLAGADDAVKPYEGNAQLKALVEQGVQDWLDGTITTATFLANIEAYTDDEVGFSAEVLAAGNVTVTADEDLRLDYTVKASDPAIKKILVATEVLNALQPPGETDAPVPDEFTEIVNAMAAKLDQGAKGLETQIVTVQAANVTLSEVKARHDYDSETLQTLVDDIENTDTTEVAVKLQNIQLQLEASYRVSAAVASLNLLNFLSPGV